MTEVQTFFKEEREELSERELRIERDLCHSRARHICERCGMRRSEHAHHVRLREYGSDRADNLMAVCQPCHDEIHKFPETSFREGFMSREFPREGDAHFTDPDAHHAVPQENNP